MKIRPMGAELFHADGQTDMTKLIFALRDFVNAPPPPPKKKRQRKLYPLRRIVKFRYETELIDTLNEKRKKKSDTVTEKSGVHSSQKAVSCNQI